MERGSVTKSQTGKKDHVERKVVDWKNPRFPISEMHLGKFPDFTEFQSWKVNFKTEVCSKSADPHLTMHWIKEVEIAKSLDELVSSRSITGRTDFTDYDVIDAMFVCVCIVEASHQMRALPKKGNVLKKTTDSFERGRFRTWYMSTFEPPELTQLYKVHQVYSIYTYKMMTLTISIRGGTKLHLPREMLSEMILEGLNKSKLQNSVQLRTALALYDQETVRNNGQPCYSI